MEPLPPFYILAYKRNVQFAFVVTVELNFQWS